MRTCGLSHQIMGPITVKMAKTGFMRKIANLQLDVPYFDKYLQELGTFLAPQNLTQGRCDI